MMVYIKKDNVVICFHQYKELREATILTNHGCTYEQQYKKFSSAEEGNQIYKSYINDGFTKASEEDYDKIVRGY